MKNSLTRSLAVLVALLSAGILAGFYALHCLPVLQHAADQSMKDKALAIAALAQPGLVNAWESRDDIALLIHIERIARMEGVSAAFLVDPAGTVIMHNKTGEWGRQYTGNAGAWRGDAVHLSAIPGGRRYSAPIASSATLCVEFSSAGFETLRVRAGKEAAAAGALFVICSVIMTVLVTRTLIANPFTSMVNAVRTAALGSAARIPAMPRNEFGDLAGEINRLLEAGATEQKMIQRDANNAEEFFLRIGQVIADTGRGVLIIDAANTVLFISEKAAAVFGISAAENLRKHVLDVVTDRAIIALIERAARTETGTPVVREPWHSSTVTCHVVRTATGAIQNIFLLVD
jgi:HAMP domain-containing protein